MKRCLSLLLLLLTGVGQAATIPAKTTAIVRFDTCDKPAWPRASLQKEETGTVTLDFLIDDQGQVIDALVRASSGAPLLDEAALTSISRCRFKPATIEGVPIGSWQKMQYVWTLETPERGKAMLQAAEGYRKAALAGDAEALYRFAQILKTGNGYEVKADLPRYFEMLEVAASNGYPQAEFEMGLARKDMAWFQKAAQHGHIDAQLKLAKYYEFDAPDPAQTLAWYRKAAQQGNHDAEDAVGKISEVAQEYAEAAAWYRKAAEGGSKNGLYHLGALYLQGRGLERDPSQAAAWLSKAAAQRQVEAEALMANLHFTGTAVAQNDEEGFKYLRRAAVAGNVQAMRQLGLMLVQGVRIAADKHAGEAWLDKAARLGLAGNAEEAVGYSGL